MSRATPQLIEIRHDHQSFLKHGQKHCPVVSTVSGADGGVKLNIEIPNKGVHIHSSTSDFVDRMRYKGGILSIGDQQQVSGRVYASW